MEVRSLSGEEESAQKPETEQRRNTRNESECLIMKTLQVQTGRTNQREKTASVPSFHVKTPTRRGPPQPAENTRKKLFTRFADNFALFPHNHCISPNPGIRFWRCLLFPIWRTLRTSLSMQGSRMNWHLYKMRFFRITDLEKYQPRNPFAMTYMA